MKKYIPKYRKKEKMEDKDIIIYRGYKLQF